MLDVIILFLNNIWSLKSIKNLSYIVIGDNKDFFCLSVLKTKNIPHSLYKTIFISNIVLT